jgi:tetratricopeptide (TPR) repeat protein
VLREYGRYLTWLEGKHEVALEALERAAVLDPLDLNVRCARGYVHYNAGDLQRASAEFSDILAVEQDYAAAHYGLGETYLCLNRPDEAIAEFERAIQLAGRGTVIISLLAHAYGLTGRVGECKQLIAELEDRVAVGHGSELCVGSAYAGLDDRDKAFEWWDLGVRERDPQMIYLTGATLLDRYKSDHRFKDLLEKMGLGHFNR